jgi:hypothetical protein
MTRGYRDTLASCRRGTCLFFLLFRSSRLNLSGEAPIAADEDDCVSYACECVRLAGLTDHDVIREQLLKLARHWIAATEIDSNDAGVTAFPSRKRA